MGPRAWTRAPPVPHEPMACEAGYTGGVRVRERKAHSGRPMDPHLNPVNLTLAFQGDDDEHC